MSYIELFRMPTPMKIKGRSSTITNAFINSIIPIVIPTEQQVKEALAVLGIRFSVLIVALQHLSGIIFDL